MRCFVAVLVVLSAICAGGVSCGDEKDVAREAMLERLFDKKKVTIAITDSGLGGLSITADVVRKMETHKIFRESDIIFYNALFSNEGGYNSLADRREKIRIFDRALKGLKDNYEPDVIIIGCNTLSAIYEETDFAKRARIPVVGIVETGVDLMARNLDAVPGSKVIIFGTQTTIEEGVHASKLMESGVSGERIIGQACPDLTEYIEKGYDSEETGMLIAAYVDEALEKTGKVPGAFFASLNCTHYGYSMGLWKDAFETAGAPPLAILNPNEELVDFLFPPRLTGRNEESKITVRVVSKVEIEKDRLESIAGFIRGISPRTAEALLTYELKEDLFQRD
jgi:glutamate racemase